jgi:hypothetical protein
VRASKIAGVMNKATNNTTPFAQPLVLWTSHKGVVKAHDYIHLERSLNGQIYHILAKQSNCITYANISCVCNEELCGR